jgi:protein-glutamine gamma-glutamyltransferase
MSLRLLHRRLVVGMSLAGLLAFAGGAGFEPISAVVAAVALVTALFWQPDPDFSDRLERIWLPLAMILVVRALYHVFFVRDDIVIPVVDLLLLLMSAEALRTLNAPNDIRLYALSFALILASTAYRPGVLFLIAFVAYIALATLALMVGHLRRKAERHKVREVPLGKELVATTGALSGVIMLVATVVFVIFPRVSRGWAGRGESLATSIVGFSDQVSIGEYGATILGNPEIVLRVEFPNGAPETMPSLHWRGRSYDNFDGTRWTRSRRLPPSSAPSAWYRDRWPGGVIEQKIFGSPLDVRVLFALHPAVDIESDNGIQPLFDNAGDFVYWGSTAPAYTVTSRTTPPPAEELRTAARGFTPSSRHFLQLPTLPERIGRLADSLTVGLDNRYDKAMAIQSWLQSFEYTRDLPATASETSLDYFLFERQAGHCEYFSTAMVVLLRSLGIQARNVNGFLGGQWSDFGNYLVVTQNEAHSWVEVWFPNYGWVTFDPTPAGAGSSELLESWFWPGKILFDAVQHRWNKWVLDYSVESQIGLFAGWSQLFDRRTALSVESGESADARIGLWGAALAALALLSGLLWARRGAHRLPPATRIYMRLRDSCAHADIEVPPGLTPLALASRVRERRFAAARAVDRIVDLYLRARYGHEPLGESELREMTVALKLAKRALRAAGDVTRPAPGDIVRA